MCEQECDATGLIVLDGKNHWVCLPNAMLVTDCARWVLAYKELLMEDAEDCHRDGEVCMEAIIREQIALMDAWPNNASEIHAGGAGLRERLCVTPYQVTRKNLPCYLLEVAASSLPVGVGALCTPSFVFDADLPTPTIWGTATVEMALRYCSTEFVSIRESASKLASRVCLQREAKCAK